MHESRYIVKQILCFSKICLRSIKLHYPKTADCTAAANKIHATGSSPGAEQKLGGPKVSCASIDQGRCGSP
jgi:hypothetical protein